MKVIKVVNPKNDSLFQQLVAFYSIFKNIPPNETINFDLSQLQWAFPLLILPISAHIQNTKSKFIVPKSSQVASYLSAIRFPEAVSSVLEFQKMLSYIPLSILKRDNPKERGKIESCFAEMVYKVLKPTVAAQNAIYYPLTELVTNIFEHSKEDIGYLFGQYYPKKEFLDLCIIDKGRGLARSYKEEKNLNLTDKEAIKQVLMGRSTKPDLERGYGIRTSKRIICEGLGGSFILLSGEYALFSSKKQEKMIFLPKFYWQGVVISYHIPRPKRPINITLYLEG